MTTTNDTLLKSDFYFIGDYFIVEHQPASPSSDLSGTSALGWLMRLFEQP